MGRWFEGNFRKSHFGLVLVQHASEGAFGSTRRTGRCPPATAADGDLQRATGEAHRRTELSGPSSHRSAAVDTEGAVRGEHARPPAVPRDLAEGGGRRGNRGDGVGVVKLGGGIPIGFCFSEKM